MTRHAGQLTTRQAIIGGLVILALVIGFAAALSLLLDRQEPLEPLDAPAEPSEPLSDPCPPSVDLSAFVTSNDLIECPDTYDGRTVRYRGEAVRAILRRGERAWVQLNDDPYALELGPLPSHRTAVGGNSGIPVSIPIQVADQITHVGDTRHRGDTLEIVGAFRRADPTDDGAPSIHAQTARILDPGRAIARTTSPRRFTTAFVAATLAIITAATAHLRKYVGS